MNVAATASRPAGAATRSTVSTWARAAFMTVALGLLVAPFFAAMAWRADEVSIGLGQWGLVVASALANVVVIAYHYAIAPHPKFLVVPWRRWVLRAHILSGTVELAFGLWACFTGSTTAATVAALAALTLHVPSSFAQTPIVFGSKAVMVPSYLLCIVTHAYCATMLLLHPASTFWAVNTFLVFNIYVWCRVYYYLFDWAHLFDGARYSVAIVAAGATMAPALFGPMGFLLLLTFVAAYAGLYRVLFVRTPRELVEFVREHPRDAFVTATARAEAAALGEAFDRIDVAGEGRVPVASVESLLFAWRVPAERVDAVRKAVGGGAVTREAFGRLAADLPEVGAKAARWLRIGAACTDEARARVVFDALDGDGDGLIESSDLDRLLVEWGMPHAEVERYRALLGDRIAFETFLEGLRPVWTYVFFEIFQAESPSGRPEMIGRALAARFA
ncbi:MAG: hypothetical protein RL199_393 [Pseudomonadota bacterium]|jgi:hypothetical protein